MGFKVVVYSDHAALRHLLSKKETKPRLIGWILLLQEFLIEIRDRKGSDNVIADHLSRILSGALETTKPIKESFTDELLSVSKVSTPWFANIVNYLAIGQIPTGWSNKRDSLPT